MQRTKVVCNSSQAGVKPSLGDSEVLTEFEERRLARAYTHGKTGAEIHEAEWQTILAWARDHRLGAVFVDLAIEGCVRLTVIGQKVHVEPMPGPPASRSTMRHASTASRN